MQGISLLFSLLRKGAEISDTEKWKQRQVSVNSVGGLIIVLAQIFKHYFGLDLGIDDATALTIAGGIIAVINVVLTSITSKRAGILPALPVPEQPVSTSHTEVAAGVSAPVQEPTALPPKPSSDISAANYFG